ncbi:Na+/H+ antiporter subunit E [Hyphomicrobium sp. D-2]|uniref:Na+/H+ antiporter subunit E n=1 Tax=Hyphomicrobium sp. D-2 TaxID=3041621 RepID=UPI00245697D7|nr:Na+/H+ antiporter subunit E [Hyphomicrobium sp. D-2]MDH4982963.1 Na+/H+ antiporter subunit E [Hyphomicrobium sp. D-2]
MSVLTRRVLPYPLLSAFLLIMWLLLNQSLSAGHLILGSIIGVAGGLAISSLQIPSGQVRNLHLLVQFAFIVLYDIIRSNIAVTRIVLTPGRVAKSGFLYVKLDIRNEYALAILACVVTSTPGTVWVNFDSAKGELLLHVLDLVDEDEWTDLIKNRYERLLKEIFE